MKQAVYFEGANAGDYYANIMHLAVGGEAEYEVVLRDGDKLTNTDMGVMLFRGRKQYIQCTRMSAFKGVAFSEYTSDPDKEVITCKLIKLK